jgi:hypothetical protein
LIEILLVDPSFLAAVGKSGRSSDFIDFIFFAIIWFFVSEHHGGLACGFRVIVPNRSSAVNWILLFPDVNLLNILLLPV